MSDIQRTLELELRHFGAIAGMGLIFLQMEDEAGALKAIEEVLKIHPNSLATRNTDQSHRLRVDQKDIPTDLDVADDTGVILGGLTRLCQRRNLLKSFIQV